MTVDRDPDDFYAVLGIERDATQDTVRKAYLLSAMRWHPDKNPKIKKRAEDMFKRISRAYGVLSDPKQRKNYDRSGLEGVDETWWPADADSTDLSWQWFRRHFPGHAPFAAFSEAKLREMFPDVYARKDASVDVSGILSDDAMGRAKEFHSRL